jgi:hypothetical protein
MKTIIAGGRLFNDFDLMEQALKDNPWEITSVVSGRARGADTLGERWAKAHGLPVHYYPAEWSRYGRHAGYLRNETMASVSDALVAFWDGSSRGTAHMITIAQDRDLEVRIIHY